MGTGAGQAMLHLRTLYTADGAPYVHEDRWVNPEAVPAVLDETFSDISPNEWLVREVPFEGGDFTFSAMTSTPAESGRSCPARWARGFSFSTGPPGVPGASSPRSGWSFIPATACRPRCEHKHGLSIAPFPPETGASPF